MSNFEILSCTPGNEIVGKTHLYHSPRFYRLTANAGFRDEDGNFTTHAAALERVVMGAHFGVMVSKVENDNHDNIWIESLPTHTSKTAPTIDELNTLLTDSENPYVRIMKSDQYPSLVTVHRSIAIGNITLQAVRQCDTIQSAIIVPTGNRSQDLPHGVYPEGTLLMVVAEPKAEMGFAVEDLRQYLTA